MNSPASYDPHRSTGTVVEAGLPAAKTVPDDAPSPGQLLSGWGRCPVERCHVFHPQLLPDLREIVTRGSRQDYISRGLGRAYGDSALNRHGGVIVHTRLNHFLAFDQTTGILDCEAGVSFAEIIDHLLPRGWFVPTTPGTKYVTVGGAIAADVHGKNHHVDGSFGNCVLALDLLCASGEVLTCSPSRHPDVFWATVGGMGLTGVVLRARLQLRSVQSAYFNVLYRRTGNLDQTLDALTETDRLYRYSVAWIDCLASGSSLGRSVLILANDAQPAELPAPLRSAPLAAPVKRKKSVPFNFPRFALNSWTVRAFNGMYYATHRDGRRYEDFDSLFYPLDSILYWNRIYGRRGFVQYQALFPPETSRAGLIELLERITASKRASFLAVLKTSGEAGQGMLSYLHRGHTLALDFPNSGNDLRPFLGELDQILLKHQGRLYLAKDAMTTAEAFAEMYPRLREFQRVKEQIDPERRFVSSQARRLKIVNSV